MSQITTTDVLVIVNILATTIAPIITGLGYCLRKIRKSRCCGGSISIDADASQKISQKQIQEIRKSLTPRESAEETRIVL